MRTGPLTATIFRHAGSLAFWGLAAFSCVPSNAATIFSFYTGDPNLLDTGATNIVNPAGINGFNNGNPYFSHVYQSFIVPAGGWTVQEVVSNEWMDFSTATAEWEIRSNMNAGNGGVVIASGTGAATQTSTGITEGGETIYAVAVNGLNVDLAPGKYWLTVAPVGGPVAQIVATNGANAVDAASTSNIVNFPAIGLNFFPNGSSAGAHTFSMGLVTVSDASAVPEPSALPVTAAIMILLGAALVLRTRQSRSVTSAGSSRTGGSTSGIIV